MPDATHALTSTLATLFGPGSYAGMSDVELLERFRTARDEGAFEAMVTRHGPMVLGVCRQLLDDPGDVHDAFQAAFLVLARRAGAIRKGGSLESWLHGVAVRVAARVRVGTIRRRVRERRALAAAVASSQTSPAPPIAPDDGAAIVHEEVLRLPESFRLPIVLCYFEGLTHDEAAARLRWPVGTVRSRLARARDRLRERLTRRGLADRATIAPLAVPVSPSLSRAAIRLAAGRVAAAGALPSASIILAEGVLRHMMLRKLAIAACAVATIGLGGGTVASLMRRARAQDAPATAAAPRPAVFKGKLQPPPISPRVRELIDAARERFRVQQTLYYAGEIAINRFLQASADLERAELLAAKTEGERRAIRQNHVDRLREIERKERALMNEGRSTTADVAEVHQARLEAEFRLESAEKQEADRAALLRRIDDLERKVEQLRRAQGDPAARPLNAGSPH